MAEPGEPTEAGGSKVHRTRTAEVIDAATEGATRFARLTPQQIIALIAVGILAFVCATQAFEKWTGQQERREVARERENAEATRIRESNAQAELTRQNCERRERELQAFFAAEGDKNRAVLQALSARIADLERAIKKSE